MKATCLLFMVLASACSDDGSTTADTTTAADSAVTDSAVDSTVADSVAPDTAVEETVATETVVTTEDTTTTDAAPEVDASTCVVAGESVPVIPDAPSCCEGLAPISCDSPGEGGACDAPCVGAAICAACGDHTCGTGENACNCPEDCATDACVAAGDSVPVIPDAPSCCEGLAPISCDSPGEGGACDAPCVGAAICAACGDDACGAGENHCNCPGDCH